MSERESDRPTHAGQAGIGDTPDPERSRIEQIYGGYRASGRTADRWDPLAAGNRCMMAERLDLVTAVTAGLPSRQKVLEIGCGAGEVLPQLDRAVPSPSSIIGVDLLADRLYMARERGGVVAQADGRRLPFVDGQFDLVAMFTVLSSVLDQQLRQDLATEALRVVGPRGAILWYDLRVPSTNRAVRPLTRRAVRSLFPDCRVDLSSVTVLPPLARRLGSWDEHLYPLLARVPLLRTHYLGLIRPR